jgi:hypothetical protein
VVAPNPWAVCAPVPLYPAKRASFPSTALATEGASLDNRRVAVPVKPVRLPPRPESPCSVRRSKAVSWSGWCVSCQASSPMARGSASGKDAFQRRRQEPTISRGSGSRTPVPFWEKYVGEPNVTSMPSSEGPAAGRHATLSGLGHGAGHVPDTQVIGGERAFGRKAVGQPGGAPCPLPCRPFRRRTQRPDREWFLLAEMFGRFALEQSAGQAVQLPGRRAAPPRLPSAAFRGSGGVRLAAWWRLTGPVRRRCDGDVVRMPDKAITAGQSRRTRTTATYALGIGLGFATAGAFSAQHAALDVPHVSMPSVSGWVTLWTYPVAGMATGGLNDCHLVAGRG